MKKELKTNLDSETFSYWYLRTRVLENSRCHRAKFIGMSSMNTFTEDFTESYDCPYGFI